MKKLKARVSIVMGSDSDLPVMKEAADFLTDLKIPFEVKIVSAHRTPNRLYAYCQNLLKRKVQVVIAGAGGAAHLPGMVASMTPLPVIGVPVKSRISIDAWDSLLSILQMPPGIPVATVAVDGARNAGILAAQILGAQDSVILKRVQTFKKSLEKSILKKAAALETQGYKKFLSIKERI